MRGGDGKEVVEGGGAAETVLGEEDGGVRGEAVHYAGEGGEGAGCFGG